MRIHSTFLRNSTQEHKDIPMAPDIHAHAQSFTFKGYNNTIFYLFNVRSSMFLEAIYKILNSCVYMISVILSLIHICVYTILKTALMNLLLCSHSVL